MMFEIVSKYTETESQEESQRSWIVSEQKVIPKTDVWTTVEQMAILNYREASTLKTLKLKILIQLQEKLFINIRNL